MRVLVCMHSAHLVSADDLTLAVEASSEFNSSRAPLDGLDMRDEPIDELARSETNDTRQCSVLPR
jgi:hypothetical protein